MDHDPANRNGFLYILALLNAFHEDPAPLTGQATVSGTFKMKVLCRQGSSLDSSVPFTAEWPRKEPKAEVTVPVTQLKNKL